MAFVIWSLDYVREFKYLNEIIKMKQENKNVKKKINIETHRKLGRCLAALTSEFHRSGISPHEKVLSLRLMNWWRQAKWRVNWSYSEWNATKPRLQTVDGGYDAKGLKAKRSCLAIIVFWSVSMLKNLDVVASSSSTNLIRFHFFVYFRYGLPLNMHNICCTESTIHLGAVFDSVRA